MSVKKATHDNNQNFATSFVAVEILPFELESDRSIERYECHDKKREMLNRPCSLLKTISDTCFAVT